MNSGLTFIFVLLLHASLFDDSTVMLSTRNLPDVYMYLNSLFIRKSISATPILRIIICWIEDISITSV